MSDCTDIMPKEIAPDRHMRIHGLTGTRTIKVAPGQYLTRQYKDGKPVKDEPYQKQIGTEPQKVKYADMTDFERWQQQQKIGNKPAGVSDWMRETASPSLGAGGYKIAPPKINENFHRLSTLDLLSPESKEFMGIKEEGEQPKLTEAKPEIEAGTGHGNGEDKLQYAAKKSTPTCYPSILDAPNVVQPSDFSCGAAAAMSAARYFGKGPDKIDAWIKELGTSKESSTDPMEIVRYLSELGLKATPCHDMGISDLNSAWLVGNPVIVMVQDYMDNKDKVKENAGYGHFLTFCGMAGQNQYLVFQDSSADNVTEGSNTIQAPGKILIKQETFMKNWHDRKWNRFGIVVGKRGEQANV